MGFVVLATSSLSGRRNRPENGWIEAGFLCLGIAVWKKKVETHCLGFPLWFVISGGPTTKRSTEPNS
jgi:hypothetical protein